MSYYQKYRPENIADLDLIAVRSAFESMMKSGNVSHAYLFVGPRGSGKTSSARILSRLVNCEKNYSKGKLNKKLVEACNECDACVSIRNGSAVDVMEIDAASNGLVDNVRDLREKVNLAPSMLSKKVYIIDEVHMMSTAGFNALLKTLEEPPEQVLFILCTTEAHKVPETIVSRCVRINFSKGRAEELMASLKRAAKGEGLSIDDEALEVLAGGVDGSFREGHKLLEQLAGRGKKLTAKEIREALNLVGGNRVSDLLAAVEKGEAKGVIELISQTEADGVEPVSLISRLLEALKTSIREEVNSGGRPHTSQVRLVRKLIKAANRVKTSPLPYLPLELALVGEALRKGGQTENSSPKMKVAPQVTEKFEKVPRKSETVKEELKSEEAAVGSIETDGQSNISIVDFDRVVSGWQDLLTRLAPRNHSVAGLLRSAKPREIKDKFLTIEVFYKFHKDQLDQEARRRIIEEEVAKMWGPLSVKCVLGVRGVIPANEPTRVSDSNSGRSTEEELKAAEEVFGA